MEFDTLLRVVEVILVPIVGGLFWYIQKIQETASAERSAIKKDLADLRVHIAEKYISVEAFKGFEDRVYDMLKRMEDKLDKLDH